MTQEISGDDSQTEPAGEPTVIPAKPKPKEEPVCIKVRDDGRIFLGEEYGWADPDEFLAKAQTIYNQVVGLEKHEGVHAPKIFSRLSLMMLFGITKKEWNSLAKLPGYDRVCDMIQTMSEAFMEKKLCDSTDRNPAGAIFALKNSHDWKDQPEGQVEDAALKIMAAVIQLPQKRPAQISGE